MRGELTSAFLDDKGRPFTGTEAAKISETLFSDNDVEVVLYRLYIEVKGMF